MMTTQAEHDALRMEALAVLLAIAKNEAVEAETRTAAAAEIVRATKIG